LGRDRALAELHEALQQTDRVAITAIAGMGGIGKTELAIQYARRHGTSYPGGVCWLRAREGSLEAQLLQKVELDLGLSVPQALQGRSLSLAAQVQWCWRNWQPAGCVLVVLDDVTTLLDCRAVLPTDQRFRVVLTTRQRGLDASFFELSLDVLEKEDAIALLQTLIGEARVARMPVEAEQLCEWLGYLPLGLELVGRYLANDRALSLREMRERLKAQSIQDPAAERTPTYDMTAQWGVKAAFELTWQTLDAETAAVAMLLSLFAADVVLWFLVEWMMQQVRGEEYTAAAARRELDNRYLIQPVEAEAGDDSAAYKLHPLIREFLQTKLAAFAESDPLRQAFMAVLIGIAQQMPQLPTVDFIAAFDVVRPHLEEVTQGMRDRLSDDDLPWAFVGLARFYEGQGLYALAEPWYADCLTATREQLGADHPAVATSLNNLAALYDSQGRYAEAEPLFVEALALRKRLLGADHPDVATSLNNLAYLYNSQGRYAEAEPLYVEALALHKRLLGAEHPAVASSLNNLALLYNSQGRYAEAEPLYVEALALRKRLLGAEHPAVATSLNNLAGLYYSQGRYAEAEPLYVEALALRKRLLGAEHPAVATSLNNLAALYYSQGRYAEAEPLYVEGLALRKRLLGAEHPDVAASLNNLALLYYSQGRYAEAEPLYVEALSIRVQKLGDNHPQTLTTRQNLEILHQHQHPDRPASRPNRRTHAIVRFLRPIIRFLKRLFRR
jgi:tetratricopeptide (TPR) repeat protein